MNLTKPQKLIYDMEKFVGGSISIICGSMLIQTVKSIDEMKKAVNELYRINDALRIRVAEENGQPYQYITEYTEQEIEVLSFNSKEELDNYASEYAKEPLDFYGSLCDMKIVVLPDKKGVLAKLHHFISDAWTLSLIGTQFNKILNGEEVQVYSYADYIEAEVKYVESKRYSKDKDYFISQFKKCDEVTYISEKQAHTFEANRATFVIDGENTSKILTCAKEKEVSVFSLFMSAVATYMNRVKMNADKFYIGTAVLNRNGAKEQNTMGMFINTAPILIELNNEESFAENLNAVELSTLSVLRHQRYNYGDLLEELRKNHNFTEKLYDIMLSYQNAKILGDEVETTWYHSGIQTESLQIHIDDRDDEGIFRVHYDYLSEKFTEHEIKKMHEHICNLLFSAVENDNQTIYKLNIFSTEEKNTILFDFNDTAVDYPKDKCVHQLFEEQVEKNADKVAVVACDKTLTYNELNEEANRIAHSLIAKGFGKGDVVAIKLSRKSYLISAILGVLKSSSAYLPIDPNYPQDRIDYMMLDSNAVFLITDDNIQNLLQSDILENPDACVNSKNLFCCIYTSGSTGQPKAVLLNHNNFCNYFSRHIYIDHILECETALSISNVIFDMFINEAFSALLFGLKLVLADETDISEPQKLAALIQEHNVHSIICTPTKFSIYLTDNQFKSTLSSVKILTFGGEVLTEELCNNISKYSDATIINGYGPTETTIVSSYGEVENTQNVSIGTPIANSQIYIVDKFINIVPIGITGELCIAGDGVGAGYLNRPELTDEKFIDNPFGKGKLYKTGDLAYWREDGNIAYVGRNDFQVKIRGLRIELGEIENAICGIEGISRAVVVVRKNNEGRQLICAFYTGAEVDAKDIRSYIGKKLPKYMLPHICTHLKEMPLTLSGKINRKALPEVDLYDIDTDVEYVAPTTEQERILVSVIEATLGIDKVGIVDNFFDVGGDSLKAIEFISRLEKNGYHTDTKTIFECDTVKDLAEKLTVIETEQETFNYSGDIPATNAQMRVYTAQSMNTNSTTYNVPYVFKVDSIDIDRLQNAINRLVARHESLRTHFENKDGNIIQVVNENLEYEVEILDNDNIINFIRPFDISEAPLLRIGVYENTIMIDMYHIITDGRSMPVFLNELNELYMGRSIETAPVQYKQFAVQKQDYTESEKYWLSVYSDEVPVLEINTDYHRGQKQTFNGSAIYDSIDIELHNKILTFCKAQNITPYVFYMSGFNILLSKFSGNEDIVVGMPISGRSAKYLDTIGMFVNTIALRNKPVGTKAVAEFLQEVKENSVNAINHQDYPYGELVKKLDIHTPDRNPLFDVMFAYQSEQMTDVVFGDNKAELLPVPITTSKYDFTFNIMPRDNDVVIMAEYCTDLYRSRTVQRFVDGYKLVLEQLLDSEKKLMNISAITKQEKDVLLYKFNNTAVDYPRNKCVHQLFEEQVEKTPDKVAVVACDKTLTYKELNEEANKIAHSLIEKGIGTGDIVAFMLSRRSYLIATMIGILKSGAAYMPIDPDYPQDRIEYMLAESKAKMCITKSNISELLLSTNIMNMNIEIEHNDIFCALHTSGSTGKPKMSLLRHNGMINFISANSRFWQDIDTVVSATIVTFDAFQMDSVLSIAQGKKLILANEDEIYNQILFEKLFEYSESNMFFSTPTKIKNYIECSTDKKYITKIKNFVIGGEVFSEQLLDLIKEVSSKNNVYNIYGPTETTICVLVDALTKDKDITIGKPIANTQIYIVDKYMKPVPIGVTGELCIAGDCVGAGYLNRPELTAEKFIDNPFGKGKLYKTGDLAYWREDGNIAYVGRNDFQVKIRGLRIELGEIENAICSVEGISQAVVVVRKNSEGRQLICAFYTGEEKTAQEIKSVIGEKLPKYMLPHIFTHLDEMPLTSSGKANRNALPVVELENIGSDSEYIEPETPIQKALCKILEQVFDTHQVGITDDFFDDLGGDSLKVIEFVAEAHNEGIYFALQNVFDYPTIEKLCEFIEKGDGIKLQFADYDYSKVNEVLSRNKVEYITEPTKRDVGNILLAGATGYLGIHILADFLDNDDGIAYCLVRGKNQEDSENRFNELLNFYFDDKYSGTDRIVVVCADLQKELFGLSQDKYNELLNIVDTVINCAASVKHYGSYKYFYEANVETTKRLIEFTKQADAVLIHTSTLSVSGNSFADSFDGYINKEEKHFYESSLYIEQPLDNVYARSKFEAEIAVLEAIYVGLPAQIMRMGNLTNRFTDGKFQKNYESNAFLQRIRAVLNLGVVPDYLMELYSEFTPIDEASNAVMTIARQFNKEQNVFHINSTKVVCLDKLLDYMNTLGCSMKTVSEKEFSTVLRQTMEQTQSKHIFEAFIDDMDENDKLNYDSNIRIENDFTVEYLRNLGFEWADIGIDYLCKYVEYFKKIGYLR